MFYVGIDLGTYLCRLVIASAVKDEKIKIVYSNTAVVNFGTMKPGSEIPKLAINRLEKAFSIFVKQIDLHKKKYKKDNLKIRCVATAAFRFSPTSNEVVEKIFKKFNIKIEVISAKEEIYLSALACKNFIKKHAIIIDIGSGSTEIACVVKNDNKIEIKDYISLDLGLVNNLTSSQKRKEELNKLTNFTKLFNNIPIVSAKCNTLKIASDYLYTMNNVENNSSIKSNDKLTLQQLDLVKNKLSSMNKKDLNQLKVVGVKKVRLVKLGLPWVYTILKEMNCKEITIAENGLKEGIVMDMINN